MSGLADSIITMFLGDTFLARVLEFLFDHRADLEAVASTSETLATQVNKVIGDIQGAQQQAQATGQDVSKEWSDQQIAAMQDMLRQYGPTRGE